MNDTTPELAQRDECAGICPTVYARLIFDGMLFGTTFEADGKQWAGCIIARDWDDAERIAADRPFGEAVDGQIEGIFAA